MSADRFGRRSHERRRVRDAAVGPSEVLAQREAEDLRRRARFGLARLGRAVGRELAGRQIDNPHRVAVSRVPGDRAAQPDFRIVGMRGEHEQIHRMTISHAAKNRGIRRC